MHKSACDVVQPTRSCNIYAGCVCAVLSMPYRIYLAVWQLCFIVCGLLLQAFSWLLNGVYYTEVPGGVEHVNLQLPVVLLPLCALA